MFREHLTCSFSLRFIMVMFYPPHCYICCHDCIQLWRFRMQPLTPWLEALRPGWFVDSHGCLESELFDLDSAPAHPMGTNSVSWSDSKTKSNPILAFRANKIKNVSTSNCCAESRWIQDLKTFHVLSLCNNRAKSPSFRRCKNLYQRSHPWKGSSCRGSRPLPVEISDQNGSNSKQSQSAIDETLFCLEQLHQIVELAMDVPANLGYTQQPWTN